MKITATQILIEEGDVLTTHHPYLTAVLTQGKEPVRIPIEQTNLQEYLASIGKKLDNHEIFVFDNYKEEGSAPIALGHTDGSILVGGLRDIVNRYPSKTGIKVSL